MSSSSWKAAIHSTTEGFDSFYIIDDDGVPFLRSDSVPSSTKRFAAMNLLEPIVVDTLETEKEEKIIGPIYQTNDNDEEVVMFACQQADPMFCQQWANKQTSANSQSSKSQMRSEVEQFFHANTTRRQHERPQQVSIGMRSSQATPAVRVEIGGGKVYVAQR